MAVMAALVSLLSLSFPAAQAFGIAPSYLSGQPLRPLPRCATALARTSTPALGPSLTCATTPSRGCSLRMGIGEQDGEQSGRKRRQLAAMLGSVLLASTQFDLPASANALAQVSAQHGTVLAQTISSSAGPAVAAQAGQATAAAPASSYMQTLRYSDFLNAVEENRVTQVRFSAGTTLVQGGAPCAWRRLAF